MNRMLEELVQAMLLVAKLPEFLWEPAVEHAAYIRNRSFTTSLQNSTPYEAWYGNKPDISNLHEFGAFMWILLQGQKIQRKMLPKSAHHAYVRHEDGSGAIKYYNAQSRKILSSHNFHLITKRLHQELTNPKPIIILLDAEATTTAACEGGSGECTCNNGKRKAESSQNESIQPKPWLMDLTENAGNLLSEDPTKNAENPLSKNTWPISWLTDPLDPATANTKRT